MKFEKLKQTSNRYVKWGLLPSLASMSFEVENFPVSIADEFSINYHTPALDFTKKIVYSHTKILRSGDTSYYDDLPIIFDKYRIFRYSSFINFFERRNIDVPRCFKKTRSLRRLNFELLFLKLANYIMKQGKKEKTFKLIALVMTSFFKLHKQTDLYTHNLDFINWKFLYFAYDAIITSNNKQRFAFHIYGNTFNQHFFKQSNRYHALSGTLQMFTAKYLLFLQPLFKFSLFNLDKRARKKQRKKNSKYLFIWKYVPTYKRRSLLLRLIVSDIKFNAGRTLELRLLHSLETLYKTPQKSYAFQINTFAHNYVFRNLRKSLLTNFKTTA